MKKVVALFVIICMAASITAFAEDTDTVESFSENMSSIWFVNDGNEELTDALHNGYDSFIETLIARIMSAPDYAREKIGLSGSDEDETEQIRQLYEVNFDDSLKIYYMKTNKYFNQYYENDCLNYLFSDKYYVAIPYVSQSGFTVFDDEGACDVETATIMLNTGLEFLKDSEQIEQMLQEHGETKINDVKIIIMDTFFNFLYIDGDNDDYMIRLYSGHTSDKGWTGNMECFELYTVSEIIEKLSDFGGNNSNWFLPQEILEEKPTYEAEAQSLQADGLLQGNENGLDLLKPLTRAEAVTLLIRVMGEESETVNYTESVFSDIASDNWASPYAALAKAKGITAGVSETEFAPNTLVTADQFAAFALRAADITDFDYTEAAEILIDRGLITEEQAESMDLFTRGDMAKIVYEAKAAGLL